VAQSAGVRSVMLSIMRDDFDAAIAAFASSPAQ
jgi:hypothetical protein